MHHVGATAHFLPNPSSKRVAVPHTISLLWMTHVSSSTHDIQSTLHNYRDQRRSQSPAIGQCCFILKGVPVTLKELVFWERRKTYLSFIIKLVECMRLVCRKTLQLSPENPHSQLLHEAMRVSLFPFRSAACLTLSRLLVLRSPLMSVLCNILAAWAKSQASWGRCLSFTDFAPQQRLFLD